MNVSRLALFCAVVFPSPAAGQYRMVPTDTLMYSEVTRGVVHMSAPTGLVTVSTLHDARIGVVFPTPGTAHAWYESLLLQQNGFGGESRPVTDAVLRQTFQLRFDNRGTVTLERAPSFPEEIAAITDLTRQFDDFFISLPAQELAIGSSWVDTVVNNQAGRPSDSSKTRNVRSYVVERDTMIDGVKGLVVRVTQDLDMDLSSDMPEQNMTVNSRLTGTEVGWAIFSPVAGCMLERQRSGDLKGELRMQPAGMAPITVQQRYEYDSRIRLVK
jgi:hypothetical protein